MNDEMAGKKKVLLPIIVAIATLVIITVGATYAYFAVNTSNDFGTTTINATADSIGSVALTSESNLTMSLTASDMMAKGSDVTYYATASGKETTETSPVIATATVIGEGTYNCSYTITVTSSSTNSLYTAFNAMTGKDEEQIVLKVGTNTYDFYNTTWTNGHTETITGQFTGITSSTAAASRQLTAEFYLVNSNTIDQSALAGKI